MIQGSHYLSEKCRWCNQLITGESEIDGETAKKDFTEKIKQHLKDDHSELKFKVRVCCFCDKVLIGWSKRSGKQATSQLWWQIQEHGKKYHPEKLQARAALIAENEP